MVSSGCALGFEKKTKKTLLYDSRLLSEPLPLLLLLLLTSELAAVSITNTGTDLANL